MTRTTKLQIVAGAVGALAILAIHAHSTAQGSLTIGGSRANFGVHALQSGFTPDPNSIHVVSGGSLNASTMGLGAGCRGFVTQQPDVILNWSGGGSLLRFFVRARGDTTLVINDAGGTWHCNDDTDGTNPMVDIHNPSNGQYDIWVGSYRAGSNISGNLYISELQSQRPGRN